MLKQLNRSNALLPQDKPVKVLQFGKGNFLRGFADWMVDILNEKAGFNGAVQIVQSNSTETDARFETQDGLYHVVVNGIHNGSAMREIRLVQAVSGVINPFLSYGDFLKAGENPDLSFIISNTTEAGIRFDATDAGPDVLAQSFPGKLTALLLHRYRFFRGDKQKGVTVLPCELIEANGATLRDTIDQYIRHWNLDEGFHAWVHEHILFCNTLVDRIVPGFPKDDAPEIWRQTGYMDPLLVAAEPYHLWVIQPLGTPGAVEKLRRDLPLAEVGLNAKFVADLTPYRISKVRILNGAHTCMVPVAWLRGLRTVKDAIDDPATGKFIQDAIGEEIIPTLDLPEGELRHFARDVVDRFRNPFIRHELKSIALNSVSKFQVRVLPSILEYHKRTNELPDRLLRALAALIIFYKGEWKGELIPVNDTPEVLEFFKMAWSRSSPADVVRQVLSNAALWKIDMTKVVGLQSAVEKHMLELLDQEGS